MKRYKLAFTTIILSVIIVFGISCANESSSAGGTNLIPKNASITLASSGELASKLAAFYTTSGATATDILNLTIAGALLDTTDFTALKTLTSLSSLDISKTLTTEIPVSQFSQNGVITQVLLPDSLTTIGNESFASSGVTSVIIPGAVTTFGERAFYNCDKLVTLRLKSSTPPTIKTDTFPSTITNIYVPSASVAAYTNNTNWSAFAGEIQATPESLPIALTTSGELAQELNDFYTASGQGVRDITKLIITGAIMNANDFRALKTLTYLLDLDISDTATVAIPDYQFQNNTTITKIILPTGLEAIGRSAFAGSGVTSVAIPASIISWGDFTFANTPNLTNVTLSNGLTKIGPSAFANTPKLTSVVLPNSLTTIESYAFKGSGLTSVTIPALIKNWGDSTFADCLKLATVTLTDGLTVIGRSAFAGSGVTSVEIPRSITSWGDSAFAECASLASVTLTEGLTMIGRSAFAGSGVTSVTIPASIASWGESTFAECAGLTSITLTEGLTTIGGSAFMASGITSVTLPASLTTLGSDAFSESESLTTVTSKNPTPPTIESTTFTTTTITNVSVPSASVDTYKAATNWSAFTDKIRAIPTP